LDASLVLSSSYTLPNQDIVGFDTNSLGPPIIQPEDNTKFQGNTTSQQVLTPSTTVQDTPKRSDEDNMAQGEKGKADNPLAKPAKKTKATENTHMTEEPRENTAGKEVDEGSAGSGEGKERVGKPTLSGRIPLMPTHLAEAGYQGEKKGVRPRKVEATKKPRSKGSGAKGGPKGKNKIRPVPFVRSFFKNI
jgi:hypothetical protein